MEDQQIFTVYILYSTKFDKIYVGYTANLIDRFHSHNTLSTKGWTKAYRPWIVAYTEVFDSKAQASKREKQLKAGNGRRSAENEILLEHPYLFLSK